MNEFHIIVLSIATIVFLIVYGFMLVSYSMPADMYPQSQNACPDYWTVNPDNTCEIPATGVNMGNIQSKTNNYVDYKGNYVQKVEKNAYGNNIYTSRPKNDRYNGYSIQDIPFGYYLDYANPQNSSTKVNFNDPMWVSYSSGGSRICSLKKWANQHEIQWDGISNYNKCH